MVWTGGGKFDLSPEDETQLIILNHRYLRFYNRDHKKKINFPFDAEVELYIKRLALKYKVAQTSVVLFMMRKYLNDDRFNHWFK